MIWHMWLLYGVDIGADSNLKVSFQIAIPSKTSPDSGGSSSSDSSDTVIDTIECPSIESGINLANRIY